MQKTTETFKNTSGIVLKDKAKEISQGENEEWKGKQMEKESHLVSNIQLIISPGKNKENYIKNNSPPFSPSYHKILNP